MKHPKFSVVLLRIWDFLFRTFLTIHWENDRVVKNFFFELEADHQNEEAYWVIIDILG